MSQKVEQNSTTVSFMRNKLPLSLNKKRWVNVSHMHLRSLCQYFLGITFSNAANAFNGLEHSTFLL